MGGRRDPLCQGHQRCRRRRCHESRVQHGLQLLRSILSQPLAGDHCEGGARWGVAGAWLRLLQGTLAGTAESVSLQAAVAAAGPWLPDRQALAQAW